MAAKVDQTIRCPHCGSDDVWTSPFGVTIDIYPPIYYDEWMCKACKQQFTVKSDDAHGVRAILKDYIPGHYYPDDDPDEE